MTDAKPLTNEELTAISDWNDCAVLEDPLRRRDIQRLLATIRRRDELIRWLVQSHTLASSLIVFRANATGLLKSESQNARDILAIVEAEDE